MAGVDYKVPLVICNGAVMIYNSHDYVKIRKDYRITGNLIGVTASHPNDSTIKGLPAVYSPFEAKILSEEGVVEVLATPESADEQVQSEYKALLLTHVEGQSKRWNREFTEKDLWYQVPTECPFRDPKKISPCLLPAPDPVKYQVYRDLWKRGYFITNGHSFGGDFLIYPQDPIVCHATHVVHVLEHPVVTMKDFITANRLCVGVKKECLFAYRNPEEENSIKYQSSIWDSTWNK